MADGDWGNQTAVTEFILLGFGVCSELQTVVFLLFFMIYIMTVVGNIFILALVVADRHLHTPMYFFLGNLSCLEICYSSAILPRLLASLLTGDRTVLFSGCFLQFYFFACLAGAECYLLSVMSYDRYLAICRPLHYTSLMHGRFCLQLAGGSWLSGFLANSVTIVFMSRLTFCGPNEIDHFFCDFTPMIKLSCSDAEFMERVAFTLAAIYTLPPFILTLTSYVYILIAILRIPSSRGRQKAFSTCSSHLIVVTVFYGTLIMIYMLPGSAMRRDLHKTFSVFYTVLTPLANPLIYSLRNREVKEALRKALRKLMASQPCKPL